MKNTIQFQIKWEDGCTKTFNTLINQPFGDIYDSIKTHFPEFTSKHKDVLLTFKEQIILANCTPQTLGLSNRSIIIATSCES